ncbi:hypothetical protein STEG23_008595 [Scotinomys teguina]
MASIKDLEGKWRLTESQGFEEYMKELGVGLALRKMGAMAKPDCIITCDGNNITVKTESTLKTTQFSCTLGEQFEETTADGRKTQLSACVSFETCIDYFCVAVTRILDSSTTDMLLCSYSPAISHILNTSIPIGDYPNSG